MFKINRKNYEKTMQFFSHNKYCRLILKIIYKYLPMLIFIGYPILITYVFFAERNEFLKVTLAPFGVFVFVTTLRKLINEQRPYEKYDISSVFNKKTQGQSMPSRHTASAFIIAMTFLYINFFVGITALAIAVLIGLSRILAGVHFVRDVLVGAGIAVIAGIVFLFLI